MKLDDFLKSKNLEENNMSKHDTMHSQIVPRDDIDFSFCIEPLSHVTLDEAEKLRDSVFDDIEDIEKELLRASLHQETYRDILDENSIDTIIYWVAKDNSSKQVIGITGLYTESDDEANCWLGWFCLDPKYRGKGLGKKLLQFSIEQAKKMQKEYLHLYTYNSKKYETAIITPPKNKIHQAAYLTESA